VKVLLAGGGTGGHINPALAIASIIKKHDPSAEFLFVGTPNGMEARLVPAAGYPMETMHVAGFQRKLTLKNIRRNCKAVYYLATSQHRAKQILKQFQPDIANHFRIRTAESHLPQVHVTAICKIISFFYFPHLDLTSSVLCFFFRHSYVLLSYLHARSPSRFASRCFRTFLYSSPINPSRNKNVRNVNAGFSEIGVFFIWVDL
jgi:hypothetical protein